MNEPIAALATPVGSAALAVLRASGRGVDQIARELFPPALEHRRARHAPYRDVNGSLIDDVVATFYAGPGSYTGEDLLEISSHGNPYIAQRILEDLYARGCRPAEAGEFTRRAFINGKLDLSQAEAVMDVIAARSECALASAQRQLRGALGRQMDALSRSLIAALAQVEAYIDFPEEDLPEENRAALRTSLNELVAATSRLIATQHYGEILRDGLKVAIVGATNAGKSSLFNRLVGSDRAIVSPEPGTTRDFIEERILAGPHALRLIDTAGLNPTPGGIEKLGIEKTWERVADADILLVVLDATGADETLAPELAERAPLVVLNKTDLTDRPAGVSDPGHSKAMAPIRVSAATGVGFEALRSALIARADALAPQTGEDAVAINARHAHALAQARDCLASALRQLNEQHDPALLASDLRGALDAFGQIGGKIDHERVLDELFATFCIGK